MSEDYRGFTITYQLTPFGVEGKAHRAGVANFSAFGQFESEVRDQLRRKINTYILKYGTGA